MTRTVLKSQTPGLTAEGMMDSIGPDATPDQVDWLTQVHYLNQTGQDAALASVGRAADYSIRVSEIFPAVQGEGSLLGQPTVFVRTGGCDFRCSWCDTLYAVDPAYKADWQPMTPAAILAAVAAITQDQPCWITLSGGNPALQPLLPLISLGRAAGYRFALETQASIPRPWFADCDALVFSPKPPSSGMRFRPERLAACVAAAGAAPITLKIVVFDDADYAFARQVHASYPTVPMYLSVGNPDPGAPQVPTLLARTRWLAECILADGWWNVRLTPQLHALLWPEAARGR